MLRAVSRLKYLVLLRRGPQGTTIVTIDYSTLTTAPNLASIATSVGMTAPPFLTSDGRSCSACWVTSFISPMLNCLLLHQHQRVATVV